MTRQRLRPTLRNPPRRTATRRPGPAIDQHRPVRSCIGCRTRRPAHELVRVTRSTSDGVSTVEVDGASSGRGAWLCRSDDGRVSAECFDAALRAKQFARAWRMPVDVDDITALRRAIDNPPTDE